MQGFPEIGYIAPSMKTKSTPCLFPLLLLVVGLFGLYGCNSTEAGREVSQAPQVPIFKGMAGEDLVAAIGKPDEIKPSKPPVEGMEIWVYRKMSVWHSMVVSGTKETPFFDPITGQYRPIMDEEFSKETRRYTEETQFLIVDGVMTAWKVLRDVDVDFRKAE